MGKSKRKKYVDLGAVVAETFKLDKGLGKGGFAAVYHSGVNLETFDYPTVLAYRYNKTGETESKIPASIEELQGKAETLRKVLTKRNSSNVIRREVVKNEEKYPYPSNGECAIKILTQTDGNSIMRFDNEWTSLMGINHPNVITVYGGGEGLLKKSQEIDGETVAMNRNVHYYAMEVVEGIIPAKEVVNMSLENKLEIIRQGAVGLQALHDHKVVHRDVKPDNLLVTREGNKLRVRVTDTGIALMEDSEKDLTLTGTIMGTSYYMSPEQAAKSKAVDRRADVYSLGATLYEFLTQRPPFKDMTDQFELIGAIRAGEVPKPISEMVDLDIPFNIIQVVEKMMHPDVNKRYQSMRDLIKDIEALQNGGKTSLEDMMGATIDMEVSSEKPVKSKPVKNSVRRKKHKEIKTNKTPWYVAGGLLAVAAVGYLVFGGNGEVENGKKNNGKKPPVVVEKDYSTEIKKIYSSLEKSYGSRLHDQLKDTISSVPKNKRDEFSSYLEKAIVLEDNYKFSKFDEAHKQLQEEYESMKLDPNRREIAAFKGKISSLEKRLDALDDKRGVQIKFDLDSLEELITKYEDAGGLLDECEKMVKDSIDLRYFSEVSDRTKQVEKLIEGTEEVKGYQDISNRMNSVDFGYRLTLKIALDNEKDIAFLKQYLKADGSIKQGAYMGKLELNGYCAFDYTGTISGKFVHGHCFYNGIELFVKDQKFSVKEIEGRIKNLVYKK